MNIDYTGMFEKVAAPGLGGSAGWGAIRRPPRGPTIRQIPSLPEGIAEHLKLRASSRIPKPD